MARERSERLIPYIGGGLAFVVGYLVMFLVGAQRWVRSVKPFPVAGVPDPPVWKLTGDVFYASHNVGIWVTESGGSQLYQWNLPTWTYLFPPLLLLATGFAVSWYQKPLTRADGTIFGVNIVKGYAILTFLGLFAFHWEHYASVGGERTLVASAGPNLASSLLLMAVIYPLVVGAVGGILAYVVRDYRTVDPRARREQRLADSGDRS